MSYNTSSTPKMDFLSKRHLFKLKHFVIQIGLLIPLHEDQSVVSLFCLEIPQFYGNPRNKLKYLYLQQKLNIDP